MSGTYINYTYQARVLQLEKGTEDKSKMETHDALICDWACNGMWLRHSTKLKFERRSLVKPVYKMDNEHIDLNTLFSDSTLTTTPTQFTQLLTVQYWFILCH